MALGRILEGRPQLKYHEAGMDLNLSTDPYESFRLFQGMIQEEYERLTGEFDFMVVDATAAPEQQQLDVRRVVEERIELGNYRWRIPAPLCGGSGFWVLERAGHAKQAVDDRNA